MVTSASLKPLSGSPDLFSLAVRAKSPADLGSVSMTRCGSTSYSTLIARIASSAVGSSTAASATTEAPTQYSSVSGPATTCTALTPGIFSAALVSMLLTFACACGERSILPKSIPGRFMSNEYFARPETLNGPSMRDIRFPISVRLSASGHLYSAIAPPSFCRLHHGRSHTHVGSASTKISAQPFLHLLGSRVWVFVKECLTGNHESRSAEATLLSVVINKGLLNRMQLVALHQSFYGGDRLALSFDGKDRARVDRLAVYDPPAS